MKKRWVFTGVAGLLGALFLGCVLWVGGASGWFGLGALAAGEEPAWEHAYPTTWDPAGRPVEDLLIQWGSGPVEVRVGEGPVVTVTEYASRPLEDGEMLSLSFSGGALEIAWDGGLLPLGGLQNWQKRLVVEAGRVLLREHPGGYKGKRLYSGKRPCFLPFRGCGLGGIQRCKGKCLYSVGGNPLAGRQRPRGGRGDKFRAGESFGCHRPGLPLKDRHRPGGFRWLQRPGLCGGNGRRRTAALRRSTPAFPGASPRTLPAPGRRGGCSMAAAGPSSPWPPPGGIWRFKG